MSRQRPVPDGTALRDLLNHAFDGWGGPAYFRWRYDEFPGYDPAAHNFVVGRDGDVVAARRIFERELRLPGGERAVAHVHGGTAVHEDYRGRGHYSDLLAESMAYSERAADVVFTFNRAGKLTTDHHLENDWSSLTLPVAAKVLSPAAVAADHVFDSALARSVCRAASKLDRTLTRYDPVSRAVAEAAGAVYGADREPTDLWHPPSSLCDVDTISDPDAETVDAVHAHLSEWADAPYRFERSRAAVRHCLQFPGATVYVAREPGADSVGAVVVAGYRDRGDLTECRVLEQTWTVPGMTKRLFGRVEADARERGADVVVACSDHLPASDWVPLGTEYMMWPDDDGLALPTDPEQWRVTTYDVL